MNIVYASDDNFAEILGVSMLSLFENNKEVPEITVYILDDAIKDQNKELLQSVASTYNRKIVFLPLNDLKEKLSKLNQQRGSLSTFSRLFLSRLIPHECDRLLYIDADTIIRHSLNDLYNQNFEGNIICGVMDCISRQHRARVGLADNAIYINAGMMLIDFQAWLQNGVESKIENIIAKFKGNVPYADQGIVNLALQGSIKCVHPRYNCFTVYTFFDFNDLLEFRQPSACPSSTEIEEAKLDPTIAHFVTLFCISRPWYKNSKGPYFDEWKGYKKMSPWANAPERDFSQSWSRAVCAKMYDVLPRSVSLTILGFCHSRLRPILMK